jgi:hypothetical protein
MKGKFLKWASSRDRAMAEGVLYNKISFTFLSSIKNCVI